MATPRSTSDDAQINAGTTVAGSTAFDLANMEPQGENTNNSTSNAPGVRLWNPLSKYASYTYQFSWYMITTSAYNQFIASGRNVLPTAGVYLIAQSGGISGSPGQTRAPGFEFDYYIDDVKFSKFISGTLHNPNIDTHSFEFNIYEPYSFRFITNLWKAFNEIQDPLINPANPAAGPTKLVYILGLRFLGYNQNGTVIEEFNGIDPTQGINERFYEMFLTNVKFKLDGKMVVYNISGLNPSILVGAGPAIGTIDSTIKLQGKTVDQALNGTVDSDPSKNVNGLMQILNTRQQKLLNSTVGGKQRMQGANKFEIKYIGDPALAETIKKATIVPTGDYDKVDKIIKPMAVNINVRQVNDKTSAASSPQLDSTSITINGATSIAQAIASIIKRSTYITEALIVKQDAGQAEPVKGNAPTESKNSNSASRVTRWFKIGVEVTIEGWDDIINDWYYTVTYLIMPYTITSTDSPYASKLTPYYGPVKRYEYWYTGKNTEILRYEQKFDNMFYLSDTLGGKNPNSPVSHRPGQVNGTDNQGTVNSGRTPQNSLENSLADIASLARATLTILGDPDFLMQPPKSTATVEGNTYYDEDGFTVNGNNQQVYIEIIFNEGIDYRLSDIEEKKLLVNAEPGTLAINESIEFYTLVKTPAPVNKGISYRVTRVISTFSKGKFTQELTLLINLTPYDQQKREKDAEAQRQESNTLNRDALRRTEQATDPSRSTITPTLPPILAPAPQGVPTVGLRHIPSGANSAATVFKEAITQIDPKTLLPIPRVEPAGRESGPGGP